MQNKQSEWKEQWLLFQDDELFLFKEWIAPFTLDDFKGKDVLECGCGGGQHTSFVAPFARQITAVDLNTTEIARQRNSGNKNVVFVESDISSMDLGRQYDVVYCVGVIHHTDNPDITFNNIYKHCKPGGTVIIWTYSAEGNELVRFIVEPVRKLLLRLMPRKALVYLSAAVTAVLYPIVHSVYRISFFSFLPYFDYFKNFRKLSFRRNLLNVFDKLNAPQTIFTTNKKCREWFNNDRFEADSISIRKYLNVSYALVGTKRTR